MNKLTKSLLPLALIFLVALPAWGAWTVATNKQAFKAGHYKIWQIDLEGDGNAESDTLVPYPYGISRGDTLLIMTVTPGTGGAAPTTTIDLTFENEFFTIWADTGIDNTAESYHSLADDLNQYPPLTNNFTFTVSDVGDGNEEITLYFLIWEEGKPE